MSDLRKAYKEAGVNVEEGYRAVELMSKSVKKTHDMNVLKMLSNFGGLYDISSMVGEEIKKPVLVSGTDGVGTKLKIAFDTDVHNTVGIDLVAMCVNDILCHGAKPLFFLDYFASGKIDAEVVADVVSGIAEGCQIGKLSLVGGETAELSGFYDDGEYDLAGFAVGVVDKDRIIDGSTVETGDVIIGLESSGIHSNGYSLVRKIVFEKMGFKVSDKYGDRTIGEELLTPTRIYVDEIQALMKEVDIKGMAHVTGGGFYENLARFLPDGKKAVVRKDSFERKGIFNDLQAWAEMSDEEMFATFNMGIGFAVVVKREDVEKVMAILADKNLKSYEIGEIKDGEKSVELV